MPYFDDDGNELFPNLTPKPSLCTICKKDEDPNEEVMCNLTRLDLESEEEFICYAFAKKK